MMKVPKLPVRFKDSEKKKGKQIFLSSPGLLINGQLKAPEVMFR
jgi:hypothetical protein